MAPTRPQSLADLDGPQAPSIVAGVGAAVMAELETSSRGAALRSSDVRLDADGATELGARTVGLAELDAGARAFVAPEVLAGAPPSLASDLYGLGLVLYRLATGQEPRFNPGRPGPPPAPSTLRPDLPAALDRAILTLLDADPARRTGALADLHDLAGPLPDLRRLIATDRPVAAPTGVGAVKYTTTPGAATAAAALDRPLGTILAIPADRVGALTPAERSAIAGRLGAPLGAVDAVIAQGRAVPVQAGARKTALTTDLPAVPVSAGGLGLAAGAAGLTLLGGFGVLLGLVVAIATLGVGLGIAGVALLPLLASLIVWVLWARGRAAYRAARSTWRELTRAADAANAHPLTGPAWSRLASVRAALAAADLPDAAEADVRSGLVGVERELERLGQRWAAANEARQAAGDGEVGTLEARLAALGDEASRLDQGLGELAVLVGRTTHAYDEDAGAGALETAMDRVLAAARLAADAVGTGTSDDDDRRRAAAVQTREGG